MPGHGDKHTMEDEATAWQTGVHSIMRILLADDQPKVRYALRALLERALGFEIVGEAADYGDAVQLLKAECPDLVLLDWELPAPTGVDLLTSLRSGCPDVRVLVMSAHANAQSHALNAGADGFVCKCDPPETLLHAVRALVKERPCERQV